MYIYYNIRYMYTRLQCCTPIKYENQVRLDVDAKVTHQERFFFYMTYMQGRGVSSLESIQFVQKYFNVFAKNE